MKYICDLCDYKTNNKKDYTKHTLTRKHKRKIAIQKQQKLQKEQEIIEKQNEVLETENYQEKLMLQQKSLIERKIKEIQEDMNEKETKTTKLNYISLSRGSDEKPIYVCNKCNKKYNYKKSFSAHIIKCNNMDVSVEENVNRRMEEHTKILKMLLDSNEKNNEICEKIAHSKPENNIIQNTTNNTTNNTINNTINNTQKVNINVFLNTECKDAMNLKEFIDKMKLTIDDLLYTKQNGYIKGITNIFVKNLEDMQPTERPIHCYDVQAEDFYIKDKDKWEHDNEHAKLNETIDRVTQKQFAKIKDWEKGHPYWSLTNEGTIDYMNMIKNLMGGLTHHEIFLNKQLIKKTLSETFDIDNTSEGLIKKENNDETKNNSKIENSIVKETNNIVESNNNIKENN